MLFLFWKLYIIPLLICRISLKAPGFHNNQLPSFKLKPIMICKELPGFPRLNYHPSARPYTIHKVNPQNVLYWNRWLRVEKLRNDMTPLTMKNVMKRSFRSMLIDKDTERAINAITNKLNNIFLFKS